MNLSGTLNAWRAVTTPWLVRPHVVVPHFSDITLPLSKFISANVKGRWGIDVQPDIRAVVIDKDNCIAKAKSLDLVEEYKVESPDDLSKFEGYVDQIT
jgi:phosphatidylglycerophosphatase GEP4